MELVLPMNYVELQEDEMMYLDGGDIIRDAILIGVGSFAGAIVGRAIEKSLVQGIINYAGGWLANAINGYIASAALNPWLLVPVVAAAVGALGWVVYSTGRDMGIWG